MASIVIKGNWKYIGQITKEFEIKKAEWPTSIPNETITVKGYFAVLKEIPLNCENWEWQEPNQQISDENVVAIAVYNGQDKDNYLNTQVKITIIYEMQKDITLIDKLELEQAEFVYDGGEKTPNIIAIDGNLELKKDQDYIVQYLDNKNAGQAKVIVNGINKYIGVKTFSFTILKASYPSEKPQDEMIVDRKITSLQAIALPQGWNWEDPNIKIDAETITVYAVYFDQENYKNYRVPIQITKEAPKDATKSLDIQLENSEFVYDGTAKTPKVIVKDEDMNFLEFGKDYDVEYQNNVFAGQGTAIVTFKNDYKGVKELSFTISKAEKPNIETTIHVDNGATKLSDISLPEGFVWEDESLKIIGNKLIAKAIYQGEDADSFLTKEIYFEIIIEEKDNAPQSNYRWLIFTSLLISLTIAGVGLIIIKYKRNRN